MRRGDRSDRRIGIPPTGAGALRAGARRIAAVVVALAAAVGIWEFSPGATSPAARPGPDRGKGSPPDRVISPIDIARMGNEAAIGYVNAQGRHATLALLKARGAVVRFEASVLTGEPPRRQWNRGSGVLVNGGRHLLVAGHVLDGVIGSGDPEFSVVMTDGLTLSGRLPVLRGGVDGAPEGDWGVVEMGELSEGGPSLRMGTLEEGTIVVMLGYSDGLGVTRTAEICTTTMDPPQPLDPLAAVGRVKKTESGEFEILAGTLPRGGSSGGAIIDLEGNLVGIMVRTSYGRSWGDLGQPIRKRPGTFGSGTTGVEEDLEFIGTPVEVFRTYLEERWKD